MTDQPHPPCVAARAGGGEVGQDLLADPRLTVVGLFVEAAGSLFGRLSAVHAAHGMADSDFDALLRLARSPGRRLRMSDLAAQVSLSTSGITRIVDRLEGRGLVCRETSPDDRRSLWAVLTDEGYRHLLADLPKLLDTIQECFVDPLTAEQLDGLVMGLRVLRDSLRPQAAAHHEQAPGPIRPPGAVQPASGG